MLILGQAKHKSCFFTKNQLFFPELCLVVITTGCLGAYVINFMTQGCFCIPGVELGDTAIYNSTALQIATLDSPLIYAMHV